MTHYLFLWDDEEGGNVEHIAEHDLTPTDVEPVVMHPHRKTRSASSGLPAVFGITPDGRWIFVVYEEVAESLIYVHTAYEPGA